MIGRLGNLFCKGRLKEMRLFSLKIMLWGDLIVAFQSLEAGVYEKSEGFFTRACSDRTRGNHFKLKECRFRLYITKKFYIMRVVRHWIKFPREAVDATSLQLLKARLVGTLSKLVCLKVSLLKGWNNMIVMVPSKQNHSTIL